MTIQKLHNLFLTFIQRSGETPTAIYLSSKDYKDAFPSHVHVSFATPRVNGAPVLESLRPSLMMSDRYTMYLDSVETVRRGSDFIAGVPMVGCEHTFAKYVGLCDTYDYCTKCDVKREL